MSNPLRSLENQPMPGAARPGRLSDRALWGLLLGGSVASLLLCYNIATQSVILGSREAGWGYGYLRDYNGRAVMVWTLASVLRAALLFVMRSDATPRGW